MGRPLRLFPATEVVISSTRIARRRDTGVKKRSIVCPAGSGRGAGARSGSRADSSCAFGTFFPQAGRRATNPVSNACHPSAQMPAQAGRVAQRETCHPEHPNRAGATPERRNVRSFPLSPPQRGEGRGEGSRSRSKETPHPPSAPSPRCGGEKGNERQSPHKHWEFLGSVSEGSGRLGGARINRYLRVCGGSNSIFSRPALPDPSLTLGMTIWRFGQHAQTLGDRKALPWMYSNWVSYTQPSAARTPRYLSEGQILSVFVGLGRLDERKIICCKK